MLPHSRPGMLQHRPLAPRACWLWCSDRQAPSPGPVATRTLPAAAAAAAAQRAPSTAAVRAIVEGQPAPGDAIAQPQQVLVPLAAPAASSPAATAPVAKLNRSLFDVLRFSGPGPELINGRLAMLGMLAVGRGEAATGAPALAQALAAPAWVYGVLLLVVYASLVPMLKGARHEAFGVFSPQAEVLNGRAAMLGFGILLVLEYQAGVPFF